MSSLDEKVVRVFGDVAVDKRLARLDVVSRLPRFISEYLITYYQRDGSPDWQDRLAKVVNEWYPDPKERDRVLNRAKQEGKVVLLDEFKVSVDLKRNAYFLHVPNLQIYDALVKESLVQKYERLLGGLWGVGILRYVPELAKTVLTRNKDKLSFTPLLLEDLKPFQVYSIDVKHFIDARYKFSMWEWVDLLVKSIGLNPKVYSSRQKLLLLIRLAPLVEGNVNLLELGPRATGKTYLYRNISYYTRIYAGGKVSPAMLFYNMNLKTLGDIGTRDAVVFDEVARIEFSDQEVVAKLKDYMVDGFFERGTLKRAHSDCSLVFMGNVELGGQSILGSVQDYLPNFMKDTAFLDRVHGLLPGWELPKIMKSDIHLATGYGLAADYLSEVIHRMRVQSYMPVVEESVQLESNYSIRDEIGVKKLLAGMLKLLFPHREFDKSELEPVVSLAVELRQYIADILTALSPAEFTPKKLSWSITA
ncbi:MAG: BREX system Lon protease-like protein BrxL [Infirmifilum sp.]